MVQLGQLNRAEAHQYKRTAQERMSHSCAVLIDALITRSVVMLICTRDCPAPGKGFKAPGLWVILSFRFQFFSGGRLKEAFIPEEMEDHDRQEKNSDIAIDNINDVDQGRELYE